MKITPLSTSFSILVTVCSTLHHHHVANGNSELEFHYDSSEAYGPASWATIDIEGNECDGSSQSPIAIPMEECTDFDDFIFNPGTCTIADMTFHISSHNIQANYDGSNCEPPRMYLPGQPYPFDAVQLHYHIGTEHALDGHHYGSEMHVVHSEVVNDGSTPRLAVLGLFFEPDSNEEETIFGKLLDQFEAVAQNVSIECLGSGSNSGGETATVQQQATTEETADALNNNNNNGGFFQPYDMVPKNVGVYRYSGSLTTPPCSEIVEWAVVGVPIPITPREFVRLYDLIVNYQDPETCEKGATVAVDSNGYTSRPVQPINGREIRHVCPTNMLENSVAGGVVDQVEAPGVETNKGGTNEESTVEDEKEGSTSAATNGTKSSGDWSGSTLVVTLVLSTMAAANFLLI